MSALLLADPGTVVRYHPPHEQGRDVMWCREGMAVALEDGRLLDTYWGSRDDMLDKFVLTEWFDSVEVLGNLADYEPLERHQRASDYRPSDRLTITRQHRLQRSEYVRIGARPHLGTRIREQVQRVRDAELAVRSAKWEVEWQRRALTELLAKRAEADDA